ncbi:MAG: hypothetical protein AAGF66_01820 [Cyanobacteria bacterium P01_H01_bin.119]
MPPEMFTVLLSSLATWIGEPLSLVLSLLSHMAILPVLWGLWWTAVIHKAGFRGASFWRLFGLIVSPGLVFPAANGLLGHDSATTMMLAIWSGVCVVVGIVLVTFLPWPIQRFQRAPNLVKFD